MVAAAIAETPNFLRGLQSVSKRLGRTSGDKGWGHYLDQDCRILKTTLKGPTVDPKEIILFATTNFEDKRAMVEHSSVWNCEDRHVGSETGGSLVGILQKTHRSGAVGLQ